MNFQVLRLPTVHHSLSSCDGIKCPIVILCCFHPAPQHCGVYYYYCYCIKTLSVLEDTFSSAAFFVCCSLIVIDTKLTQWTGEYLQTAQKDERWRWQWILQHTHNEWVSSFLTAHQQIKGHSADVRITPTTNSPALSWTPRCSGRRWGRPTKTWWSWLGHDYINFTVVLYCYFLLIAITLAYWLFTRKFMWRKERTCRGRVHWLMISSLDWLKRAL